MSSLYWESPDGKIKKNVISIGDSGIKPAEGSECKLIITNATEDLSQYSNIVIGDVDFDFGRKLEICVTTMFKNEVANFIVLVEREYSFTLELTDFKFDGLLYEWDARKKYDYAEFQKEKGRTHFSNGNIREAGFRFNKGIKIASSIPIDVQDPPEHVDGVSIAEINQLKAILYNNLGTCFFKKEHWHLVIEFCDKVFIYDVNNLKASYRIAVAYMKDGNFEKADMYFRKVLEQNPCNKSATDYHKFVKFKLKEAIEKCDLMAKRMIGDILKT
ncbi:hypothetical protein WA026_002943 [Henosepilachna vigintioctopunctata]|uniref:Tetratricopeptide repeat protein n=1 Tax=Henosepilachna vigintioctopunctata TaxID=420089 RepID=A0AAW1TN63_9CUCU